ncbi:unnamed protein product, partial [Phaeothamnion confervicola]
SASGPADSGGKDATAGAASGGGSEPATNASVTPQSCRKRSSPTGSGTSAATDEVGMSPATFYSFKISPDGKAGASPCPAAEAESFAAERDFYAASPLSLKRAMVAVTAGRTPSDKENVGGASRFFAAPRPSTAEPLSPESRKQRCGSSTVTPAVTIAMSMLASLPDAGSQPSPDRSIGRGSKDQPDAMASNDSDGADSCNAGQTLRHGGGGGGNARVRSSLSAKASPSATGKRRRTMGLCAPRTDSFLRRLHGPGPTAATQPRTLNASAGGNSGDSDNSSPRQSSVSTDLFSRFAFQGAQDVVAGTLAALRAPSTAIAAHAAAAPAPPLAQPCRRASGGRGGLSLPPPPRGGSDRKKRRGSGEKARHGCCGGGGG